MEDIYILLPHTHTHTFFVKFFKFYSDAFRYRSKKHKWKQYK